MQSKQDNEQRTGEFSRNAGQESLLEKLSADLPAAESRALNEYRGQRPSIPPVFVMGAPRCGSTLFMQWLAATGAFAYPTNLLSRFWSAPITGARIQKLLTDPAYDFRDELYNLKYEPDFSSHHGKTTGALAPNEFWYFWRHLGFTNQFQRESELSESLDAETLSAELAGLTAELGKPFATKGMIFNEHIPLMARLIPNAIFVWIRRQPEYNIQSLLQARERQLGDLRRWYSFEIEAYPKLAELDPVASVSGQVAAIHQAIANGLQSLPPHRKLTVEYADFCQAPESVYRTLAGCLESGGDKLPAYGGPSAFRVRDQWRLDWVSQETVRQQFAAMMGDSGTPHMVDNSRGNN